MKAANRLFSVSGESRAADSRPPVLIACPFHVPIACPFTKP